MIEAAVRSTVMESVAKVGCNVEDLCKHLQEHDAKLNSMAQKMVSATEASQAEMESLASLQCERVEQSDRVAAEAQQQMKVIECIDQRGC